MTTLAPLDPPSAQGQRASGRRGFSFARTWWVRVWLVIGFLVLGMALFGPYLAPHSPTELAGVRYQGPSGSFLLGTDALGRDVFSRMLHGGRQLIALAVAATLLAYLVGGAIGLIAGYRRGSIDAWLMRVMDALLTFPGLLFLLLLAYGAGPGPMTIVAGVSIVQVPAIARLVRAAALGVAVRAFVEAAVARGERTSSILVREILPNIAGTVSADAGARFTGSFLAIAALNFLGLGIQPPAPDWATMIAQNRDFIQLQPWAVAGPALLVALFTISVNIVGDAMARDLGRSSAQ